MPRIHNVLPPPSVVPFLRMGKRCLTLMIAVLAALTLVSSIPGIDYIHDRNTARLIPFLAIVVQLRLCTSIVFDLGPPPDAMNPAPRSTLGKLAQRYEDAVLDKMTTDEVVAVLNSLLRNTPIERTYQTVTLCDDRNRHSIRLVAHQRPEESDEIWARAVCWTTKGRPLSNLEIKPGDSNRCRTLDFTETAGILLILVDVLVAGLRDDLPSPASNKALNQIQEALRFTIANYRQADQADRMTAAKLWASLVRDWPLPNSLYKSMLAELILTSGREYPVVMMFDKAHRMANVNITFGSRITAPRRHRLLSLPRITANIHNLITSSFGLSERTHNINLALARISTSYHLTIVAPEGSYIYRANTSRSTSTPADSKKGRAELIGSGSTAIDPHFGVSDSIGGESVEIYARDYHLVRVRANSANMPVVLQTSVSVETRERPPGAIALLAGLSVLLTSLLIAAGIWHDFMFGMTYSGLLNSGNPNLVDLALKCRSGDTSAAADSRCTPSPPSSSAVALIVALPAIISGWLASKATRQSLRNLSISTVAIFFWVVINTILAPALVAVKLVAPLAKEANFLSFMSFQFAWTWPLLSSTTCSIMCILLLGLKVHRFRKATKPKRKTHRNEGVQD